MFVPVNGVRLFVDVLSPKLVPSGPRMIERPTVVALHGGPSDHAHMREVVAPLSDGTQVVLFDHRGCGRSERGDPSRWTMDQWGDDVRGLCDALGIEKPIVIGMSFGGFVAQAYMTRHPGHAEKVALVATGARMDLELSREGFRKQGGDAAARAFEAFARDPDPSTAAAFMSECRALYTARRVVDGDLAARARSNLDLAMSFFRHIGDPSLDFRERLGEVTTPVLIIGGDEDPILPPQFQDELERELTSAPTKRVRLPAAGHFIHVDQPERFFGALREFVGADAGHRVV
jgi:pimeloyl-ACP methyl ester carboxylesterase